MPNSPLSWEIESKKIWLKQPKAASALDFSYFQRVSKLVTHDIRKQLVQSDGLFLRFLVRKRGLAPLTQGRQRGVPAPHHFPRLMKGCPLSFPVPVQKEEGLREEHGSARQIARGPLCGAAMAFPQKRPRSGGSRFVRRPRRSNAKGPPQNLFCGEGKSHPRNHVE